MKFVLFKKSLEEGASPIYLFDGEEEYFKERGEEMLKQRFLGEPSLNYTSFQGEALKGSALTGLVAAAESFPFMSEKRIVKVSDFYPSEKDFDAYLRKYFQNPQPSTILLIVNSAAPKGKGFDLRKAPGVTWVDCSKADEETVLRWIFTRLKKAGISADTECCERIMLYCLGDMSRIAGETEKLIAYASETKKLTLTDVDEVVFKDTDYRMYEMTNALGMKNYGKYLSVMNELLAKGVDEMAVLNTVFSYFRTMYEIGILHKPDAETAQILGMKEYPVKVNRRQAASFGAPRVRQCFMGLLTAINDVKNGRLTPQGALLQANALLFFGKADNNGGESA